MIKEIFRRVDDVSRMRALGFCVSVEHAQFMALVFKALPALGGGRVGPEHP